MADDAELLQCYLQGSEEAFSELVRRHANLVYSVALRQTAGDAHLAADVMSGVFMDLARKARSLAGHPVLGGWLYQAARFAAADAVRAEQRRRERERKAQMTDESAAEATSGEVAVDWERARPMLDHAISELSPDDRNAVVLRFFEGRSFGEMGAQLRLSENAARKRLVHALDRLQRVLRRRGVRSTEAALAAVLAQQVATAAPAALVASIGAPAAAAAPLGLLTTTLMKTAQIWKIGTALAVLAAAATTVVRQHQTIGTLQTEIASLKDSRREADRMRDENAKLKEAVRSQERAGAAFVAGPEGPRGISTKDVAKGMGSPEMERMMAYQAKMGLDARYARLFKQLRLSPEKLDALKQLMVSRTMFANDVFTSAMAQGLNPAQDRQELADMTKEGQAKIDDEIKSLLGSDYSAYQSYQETLPQRLVVGQLQQSLSYTSDPLTDTQAEQLTQILAQNPAPPVSGVPSKGVGGSVAFIAGYITSDSVDLPPPATLFNGPPISDAAVAAAASILTPAQLAALQSLQQQQATMQVFMSGPKSPAGGAPSTQQIQVHSGPG